MTELHWTEVNGVATIWTEAPEPLRAGLLFRTGRVDEKLITAGYTHLIEHLALSNMNSSTQVSNGFVSSVTTGFFTMGRPEDVSNFFRRVCESLRALPADRLEAEKKILLTEWATRRYNVCENLLIWRFGAAGNGLIGLPELGIRGASIEQLDASREQRFTSGNALLWLSGPPPADLCLDLPPGGKQPLPCVPSIQPAYPCWYVDDQCGGVAAGATVPRAAEAPIFNIIVSKRLHDQLRAKQAVSYAPTVFYDPLDADIAHLVVFADSEQNRRAELAQAFGEVFNKLAEIDVNEVDTARKQYRDYLIGPLAPPLSDKMFLEVQRAAIDWLLGRPYQSSEQLAEEALSVSAASVSDFAFNLKNNSIFAVPGRTLIQPWMGKKAPNSTGQAVEGREIPLVDAPIKPERLIYGPDGVSILLSDDTHITARYSDLVAGLHYDDGCVRLVSSDSTWLTIEPTLWRNGPSLCREICGRIPANLLLEQGARSNEAIPKPSTTAWQRFRALLRQYW